MLLVLFWQFSGRKQVMHYLPQIDIYGLFYLESQVQINAEYVIRTEGLDLILSLERTVGRIDADEPVRIRLLRLLIEDRVQDISVDLLKIRSLCYIYKIIGAERDIFIFLKAFDRIEIIPHRQLDTLHAFELGTAVPAEHHEENGK